MPPFLGFPTENGRFVLDTDASLFAVGGVLSQLQDDMEVVIAYASRSLRLSQRRYCMTHREMLAAVVMCTHFRSYLWGAQFTLRTDHTVQITFIFIGQTRLVFGNRVCTCVTKHSSAFRTFLNWLKNSKRVFHEPKLQISRLPLFANLDL